MNMFKSHTCFAQIGANKTLRVPSRVSLMYCTTGSCITILSCRRGFFKFKRVVGWYGLFDAWQCDTRTNDTFVQDSLVATLTNTKTNDNVYSL